MGALIHVCVVKGCVTDRWNGPESICEEKSVKEQCGYDSRQGHICDTPDTELERSKSAQTCHIVKSSQPAVLDICQLNGNVFHSS